MLASRRIPFVPRAFAPVPVALAACALSAACAASPLSPSPDTPSPAASKRSSLTTRFTYRAFVPAVPTGSHALDLWLPLPSASALQTVSDIEVDSPTAHRITREARYGNRMVYVHFTDLAKPV